MFGVAAPVAADSATRPSALTVAWSPIHALVFLMMTGTAAAAPTLTEPETDKLPEMDWISSPSSAEMRMLPPASTWAPSSAMTPSAMNASVVTLITDTPAFTATATD